MKRILIIFKNPNFTKLFFANFTSQMGSIVGLTAFMFYMLDRFSTQPIYATITEMMFTLPMLFVFFLVGVFADRLDRQKVAYHCDLICFGLSIALMAAVYTEIMPLIFAVLFLRAGVQKFFYPSEAGIMQGIIPKEDYTTASGFNQLVQSVFSLFGNGIGIFFYWNFGVIGAITVDAITFIISAFLIKSLVIDEKIRQPNGHHRLKDLGLKLVFADFKFGLKYIVSYKLLLSLISGFIIFGVINGGFSVMPMFILKYKLAPNSYEQYSIILGIIFGVGLMIGSVVSPLLAQKVKLHQLLIGGLFAAGVFVGLCATTDNIWIFFSYIALLAFTLPFINVAIGGWMPRIVEPKMMGRVNGWIGPLMLSSQTVTLGMIAILFPTYLSIELLFWLIGACCILVSLMYLYLLPKYLYQKAPTTIVEVSELI